MIRCMAYITSQARFAGIRFACMKNAIAGVLGKHMGSECQSNAATPSACSHANEKQRQAALSHLSMCSCTAGAADILDCEFEHVALVFGAP